MRCICGYEQDQDFPTTEMYAPVKWDKDGKPLIMKRVEYTGLYLCPVCGTVKVNEATYG